MKVDAIIVNYIIDGSIRAIPTKIVYEQLEHGEFQTIRFEVNVNNRTIKSKSSSSIEFAVKYLQKVLPNDIRIACCQSCLHGNFNPFGDLENEIFCLKDKTLLNLEGVISIFSKQDKTFGTRSRKLLDCCPNYKQICANEKYTYNDWPF